MEGTGARCPPPSAPHVVAQCKKNPIKRQHTTGLLEWTGKLAKKSFVHTFSKSFLSCLRAGMSRMKYNKMNDMTTANTTGLLKRLSKLIALQSIVFGATTISPPNDVKCVHKHCVPSIAVFGPTFIEKDKIISKRDDKVRLNLSGNN